MYNSEGDTSLDEVKNHVQTLAGGYELCHWMIRFCILTAFPQIPSGGYGNYPISALKQEKQNATKTACGEYREGKGPANGQNGKA